MEGEQKEGEKVKRIRKWECGIRKGAIKKAPGSWKVEFGRRNAIRETLPGYKKS
jgi:hypothetical protein